MAWLSKKIFDDYPLIGSRNTERRSEILKDDPSFIVSTNGCS